MPHTPSILRQALSLVTVLFLLGRAAAGYAADTYSAGDLTIPTLVSGNAVFSNVLLSNMGLGNIVSEPTGAPAKGTADTYNPANNQLVVPAITVGSSTFYNLVLSAGTLVSIGSVAGADTYDGGGRVTIPSVQIVGGAVYNNVVISVSLNEIVRIGGGMPAATRDLYNPAGGQLTIAAIQYGAKVYTNVVLDVSLGNIVSIGGGTSTPAVYVIDSTHTLFAFDANGVKLASVALPSGINNLSGGGISTDALNVYVTIGSPSSVAAFNKITLAPVTLAGGAFSGLSTPRGIAYDSVNSQFYVGNGGSDVTVYNAAGAFLSAITQSVYGPSGAAFDPLDGTIWIANLTGGTGNNPTYGVAEFDGNGSLAQNLNAATVFQAPVSPTTELPYSIGYCAPAAASGAAYVVVGYVSDNSRRGVAEGGVYTTAGAQVAAFSPQLSSAAQPNEISCTSAGLIYVAANDGLHIYSASSSPGIGIAEALPGNGFVGLTAPIYGVYAASTPAALATPPAVFVVDSTNTLFAYDAAGNYLNKVSLGAAVGSFNGGGITVGGNNVYVTVGPRTNGAVLAFNATTLLPATLPDGAFAGLANPTGIAFSGNNSQFYVADFAGSVDIYNASGGYLAQGTSGGAAGIAFDATSDTLWVANFLGQADPLSIIEFNENLTFAQTINATTQFLAPGSLATEDDPVAISYCATSGYPPSTANIVAVGFNGYTSKVGGSALQTFSTSGAPFGDFIGTVTNPHALSCSSHGEIFVAADNGLLEYNVTGSEIGPAAGTFEKLTPPIYGVFVSY